MKNNKIVRSICWFAKNPEIGIEKISEIKKQVEDLGYEVQTTRLCSPAIESVLILAPKYPEHLYSVGTLSLDNINQYFTKLTASDISFNLDLSEGDISNEAVAVLFRLVKEQAERTFNFTYTFQNRPSAPFYPSAHHERDGYSIGLQSTNLSNETVMQEEWLTAMKDCWDELSENLKEDQNFLGIDSSVAPLNDGQSSYVGLVNRLSGDFSESVTTDFHLKVTNFLKTQNPHPIGLCGLMFPCLEDDLLAKEYEAGNFSIERNVFLSLHSGLGIDTYPIGVDESSERVLQILQLVQGLAAKYDKPLSVRFVSDGKAKIGERTDFQNQYLEDVKLLAL